MQVKTLDDYRAVLKYAIQREEDAIQFYQRMSEKVHQPDPKTLLKRIAIEEKEHKEMLVKFSSDVTSPPGGSFTPPAYSFDQVEEKDITTEKIFQLAIQLEEESLNFYARFLVYFFKTGHGEIFRKIFELELKHKEDLEKSFDNFFKK